MTMHAGDTPLSPQLSRRHLLKASLAMGGVLAGSSLLSACGGSAASGSGSTTAAPLPSYYPASYDQILKGSQKEGGKLTFYSNQDIKNVQPLFDAFRKQYPWVPELTTSNFASAEVFQRYYSEMSSGGSPCDIINTGSPQDFLSFIKEKHLELDYKSPELAKLPNFAELLPGLYTFGVEPDVIVYNKQLLDPSEYPKSIEDIAHLVTSNPSKFKGKVTTYSPDESYGFAIHYHFTKARPNGWQLLEQILPAVRPELSGGTMVEKINSGEDLVAFFVGSTNVFNAPQDVMGWSYGNDSMPMFLAGTLIPKSAPNPNTAKLFLDFTLSKPGQEALYAGAILPYRPGLSPDVKMSYQSIEQKIGKQAIIPIDYRYKLTQSDVQSFTQRWKSYLA